MHSQDIRDVAPRTFIPRQALSFLCGAFAAAAVSLAPSFTENAVANGDTRTIHLYHAHTGESISATYLVHGQYDRSVLQQLNWFLRDWRRDEPTTMDPRLFDVVWEAYRGAGAEGQVIKVVSAYRSPETNAMLRRRSRAVAKFSQHMLGKAMDTTMPGMPMSQVREIGMRMQRGGVGYYPNAGTPFVHLDVGSVRAWPRMSYEQLVRLFPDGKTVHLPSNGQPLAGYYEAKAEIEARNNGAIVTEPRKSGGLLAFLFGGGEEDEDAVAAAPPPSGRKQWASLAPRMARAARGGESDEEGGESLPDRRGRRGRPEAIARAESNLPRGETTLSAPSEAAAATPEQNASAAPAPLPPLRPASLDRVADAPLPPGRPAALALLTTNDAAPGALRNSLPEQDAAITEPAQTASDAPLPPRRPADLQLALADAPLPPTRPGAFGHAAGGAAAAIANLMGGGDTNVPLPAPAGDAADASAAALAYAAPAQAHAGETAAPAPQATEKAGVTVARRGEFVPARLDRSNFRTLTAAAPASHASGVAVIGWSVTGVRSAARATETGMFGPPTGHVVANFAAPPESPPTDKFSEDAPQTH